MSTGKDERTSRQCLNCGALQPTPFCGRCGQHERASKRLRTRDIAAHWSETLLDADSALPATILGLVRNPGQVCLDYVQGRRKRYMNPFAFVLVAITAHIILSAILDRLIGAVNEPDADALSEDALTWLMFLSVMPLAAMWTKLFKASAYNFAENYVLGLYIVGQIAWLELIALPLNYVATSEAVAVGVYAIVWFVLTVRTGTTFYSMPWYSVLWRMLLSSIVSFIAFGVVIGIVVEVFTKGMP